MDKDNLADGGKEAQPGKKKKAWLPGLYPGPCGHRPAVTSNPALPGDAGPIGRPRPIPPRVGGLSPSSWQTPGRRGRGGVDRKLVEGQGPSSLITPMQQKPGAFDTAFILLLCSFVEPSALCGLAAGVSIITSCSAPRRPIIFNLNFVFQRSADKKHKCDFFFPFPLYPYFAPSITSFAPPPTDT